MSHPAPASRALRAPLAGLALAASVMAVGLCASPTALAATGPGHSASAPTSHAPTLALSVATGPGTPADLVLTARLKGDGSARSVAFFVVTNEFGGEDVPIGTATTAPGGAASVSYTPTWSGKERFIAKVTSGPAMPTATAYYEVAASSPGPLYAVANPPRPASAIGHVFVGTLLGIVGLVWLTLIGMLLLVVSRLPRLAIGGVDGPCNPLRRDGWRRLIPTDGGTAALANRRGGRPSGALEDNYAVAGHEEDGSGGYKGTIDAGLRRQRRLQVLLGLVWLLDGALQFQPFMFGRGFVTGVLLPSAQGNPRPIADSITAMAHFVEPHIAAWNILFATVQVLLGAGLLLRRTVKPALAGSFAWALICWWFGEGLGGILTGASPLVGGIGCLWYIFVGLLAWPRSGEKGRGVKAGLGLLGDGGARALWALFWAGSAALLLERVNLASGALASALSGAAGGQPGWYAKLLSGSAHLLGSNGTALSVAVAVVMLLIGLGVALGRRGPVLLGAAALLALVIWVFPEGLGGILTGQGTDPNTGPLIALAALGLYQARLERRTVPATLPRTAPVRGTVPASSPAG